MVNPIQFTQPQAYSGGADFSPLAKLGDIYNAAQDRAMQEQALSQLGSDPTANAQVLAQSGVLPLAQMGLNMQDRAVTRQREDVANAQAQSNFMMQMKIRSAQEARAQGDWEKADSDAAQAGELYKRLFGTSGPPAAPAPAAPPSADVFTRGAPSLGPNALQPSMPTPPGAPSVPGVPGVPGPASPPVIPVSLNQAPPAAPGMPAIPPSPVSPGQLAATGAFSAQVPAAAGRVADNLTSDAPAADAGVQRELLGEMYKNPLTRPLAMAYAQKALSPGEWKFDINHDTGRVTATNSLHPELTKDVTPLAPGGIPMLSKDERERQSIYDDAVKSGFSPEAATFMKFNKGKPPSENMTPMEIKTFNDLNNSSRTADIFVGNLKRMQELSKTAYEGAGAQQRANLMTATLGDHAPQAALDTQKMAQLAKENAALQLRSTFGSRPAVIELQYLQDLESNPFMPRSQRQDIYTRLIDRFSGFSNDDKARAEAIQQGTLYKKGPGNIAAPPGAPAPAPPTPTPAPPVPTPPPAPPVPTAPTAKPSLKEFMDRARTANPGTSDSELANYWKTKYDTR